MTQKLQQYNLQNRFLIIYSIFLVHAVSKQSQNKSNLQQPSNNNYLLLKYIIIIVLIAITGILIYHKRASIKIFVQDLYNKYRRFKQGMKGNQSIIMEQELGKFEPYAYHQNIKEQSTEIGGERTPESLEIDIQEGQEKIEKDINSVFQKKTKSSENTQEQALTKPKKSKMKKRLAGKAKIVAEDAQEDNSQM